MAGLEDLMELVRAPAALTVPGDSLAGAAAAGWPLGRATLALPLTSVCLYWAGMALNDYADRHVDAVERPARPIPSGRVEPRLALGVAGGLTATGLGIAAAAGGRHSLALAGGLAATVWGYDMLLKNTPAAPVAMAATRGLDVLLGAGTGRLAAAAPAAATVGAHTLAVTTLSRSEVTGSRPTLPLGALTATIAVAGASTAAERRGRLPDRIAATAARALYAGTCGGPQWQAATDPVPARLQRAVGAGIHGMIPLQAALLSGRGAHLTAGAVLTALPLARRLSRKVSPT